MVWFDRDLAVAIKLRKLVFDFILGWLTVVTDPPPTFIEGVHASASIVLIMSGSDESRRC
jgi:hypothetical protein